MKYLSILQIANEASISAQSYLDAKYGKGAVKILFKEYKISITIEGNTIYFLRLNSKVDNHHVYEYPISTIESNYEEFNDCLRFVKEYMKKCLVFEKTDGYLITQEDSDSYIYSPLNLEAIKNLNHTGFSPLELETAFLYFNGLEKNTFIGGDIGGDARKHILQAASLKTIMKQILKERSTIFIFDNEENREGIIYTFGYQGEKITVKNNFQLSLVEFDLASVQEFYSFPLPFEKIHFDTLLTELKQKRYLKNLVEPKPLYFITWLNFVFDDMYGRNLTNAKDGFQTLSDLIGDWEQVELFFKEMWIKLKEEEGQKPEVIDMHKRTAYMHEAAYTIIHYKKYELYILKYLFLENGTVDKIKVFISKDGNPPPDFVAFEQYLTDLHT